MTLLTTDLPIRCTCWHDESTIVAGGAWSKNADANQIFNYEVHQTPGANGDTFTQAFFLRAGTYTLTVLGITDGNSGKADIYIDDAVAVVGQDWYSAGTVRNVEQTASVAVPSDGNHILKFSVNGKNAGSGGYKLMLTCFSFKQGVD